MTFAVDDYQPSGCGYATRNCTDFAQWRMRHDMGMSCVYWGNALDWVRHAQSSGHPCDGAPRVHDVFMLGANTNGAGPLGHVGVVLGIRNPYVYCEDYNFTRPLAYGQHWLPIQHTWFIHLAAASAPAPTPTATTFVVTVMPGVVGQSLHVHTEPTTKSPILLPDLQPNTRATIDQVAQGEAVSGDTRWYHVVRRGWVTAHLVHR